MNLLELAVVVTSRCARCRKRRGHATWSICADGNRARILCVECDIALNRLVMEWAKVRGWRAICRNYARRARRLEASRP